MSVDIFGVAVGDSGRLNGTIVVDCGTLVCSSRLYGSTKYCWWWWWWSFASLPLIRGRCRHLQSDCATATRTHVNLAPDSPTAVPSPIASTISSVSGICSGPRISIVFENLDFPIGRVCRVQGRWDVYRKASTKHDFRRRHHPQGAEAGFLDLAIRLIMTRCLSKSTRRRWKALPFARVAES